MEYEKITMIDLCAGTGAFSKAFIDLNDKKIKCVFSNDIVKESKLIYDLNFEHKLTLGDLHLIKNEDIPKHNILTMGFSCTAFSIAGLKKGFNDDRSKIFFKGIEIIKHHKPEVVIFENVKNLLTHDNGNSFKTVKDNVEELGYEFYYKILNTSTITEIPQHRERLYMVGINKEFMKTKKLIRESFNLDFEEKVKKPITDMLINNADVLDKYYYNETSAIYNKLKESVININTIYQYRRVYIRENKNNECPTLTANMGTGGHNVPIIMIKLNNELNDELNDVLIDELNFDKLNISDDNKLNDKLNIKIRKLTPRECFNFQGFPPDYKLPDIADSHLYKLAGNAVSVPVVKLIAERVIKLFN